jgi:hypothetical protein
MLKQGKIRLFAKANLCYHRVSKFGARVHLCPCHTDTKEKSKAPQGMTPIMAKRYGKNFTASLRKNVILMDVHIQ